MGAPEPNFEWLLSHASRLPNQTWDTVFERAGYHEDDGHMCKMIRGMKHAENVSKPKQPIEWTEHFDLIRRVGYLEAWVNIPLRSARVPKKSDAPLTNSSSMANVTNRTNGASMTNGTGPASVNGTTPAVEKPVKSSEKLAQIPERPVQAPQATAQVSAEAN
ncbi:hypothetical protein OEA41_002967 [Lepraria neglecta]|uniref:Uncharacterized protein n=1 Tax=Lepraria neglecta TaxID=209136 RepID=A0AAD9Z572_9LECA|nr:hypothetical protein OEA41_002967 [Lepraria neglecta]